MAHSVQIILHGDIIAKSVYPVAPWHWRQNVRQELRTSVTYALNRLCAGRNCCDKETEDAVESDGEHNNEEYEEQSFDIEQVHTSEKTSQWRNTCKFGSILSLWAQPTFENIAACVRKSTSNDEKKIKTVLQR